MKFEIDFEPDAVHVVLIIALVLYFVKDLIGSLAKKLGSKGDAVGSVVRSTPRKSQKPPMYRARSYSKESNATTTSLASSSSSFMSQPYAITANRPVNSGLRRPSFGEDDLELDLTEESVVLEVQPISQVSDIANERAQFPVQALSLMGNHRTLDNTGFHGERDRQKQVLVQRALACLDSLDKSVAKLQVSDLMPGHAELSFIGEGLNTNHYTVRKLMDAEVFGTKYLAVVRDVFERNESGFGLSDYLDFASPDVAVVLKTTTDKPFARLVNEYMRMDDDTDGTIDSEDGMPRGRWELLQHDINFAEYLTSKGYRILRASTFEEIQEFVERPLPIQQSSHHVLMVAPTAFVLNEEAASDNKFMKSLGLTREQLQSQVLKEFSGLYYAIREQTGVHIHLFTHEKYHSTPDAVFPNNWFSTHSDLECEENTIVLYPMKVPNRRKERRPEFLKRLEGFKRYTHVLDLTRQENKKNPAFLEGTGSLVLDRIHRIAYVCLSERSDATLAKKWARLMQYELVLFSAFDDGEAIYHTNVMMAIGSTYAVVCGESIVDETERDVVFSTLARTNHEIVDISIEQMRCFCGNVLELENSHAAPVLVMSSQSYHAFDHQQLEVLKSHAQIVHADIRTIEAVGGGGVRCTIAQLM